MNRSFVLHPYLFALGGLLFAYLFTLVIASPVQVIRPLLFYCGVLALLTFPINRLTHDRHWTAVLLSVISVGIFSIELFFYIVLATSTVVIASWLLVSTLRKRTVRIEQVTLFLNTISVLLVFLILLRIFTHVDNTPFHSYQRVFFFSKSEHVVRIDHDKHKPDIYYIVLDGYTRADILKELYNFDNTDFLAELEARNFTVPSESYSNYPKTALSITSTLNMNYIETIAPGLDDSFFWWLMTPLSSHNQTRRILEEAGYQSVSIASDWGTTNNSTTDYYFKPHLVHFNDFEGYLLAKSPVGILRSILSNVAFVPTVSGHRQLVNYEFSILSDVPDIDGPKFVFAHIVSPHPPFVFDSQGQPVDPGYPFSFNDANDFPGTEEQYREGYVNQVQYVNSQILRMIDEILSKSETPPVIILQADHGSGMLTDFRSSEKSCIRERFSVFAAYHFPGIRSGQIPDQLSAVNVFRLVLNLYFDANLPLLDDNFYYFKDTVYIYRTEDVSSRVFEPCTRYP